MTLLPPRELSEHELRTIRDRADRVLGHFGPTERDGLHAISDRAALLSHLAALELALSADLEQATRELSADLRARLRLPDDPWADSGIPDLARLLQDESAEAPD